MAESEATVIADELEKGMGWSERYRRLWSVATHSATPGVIALSLLAAAITHHEVPFASYLSVVASILAALRPVFMRKWSSYRSVHTDLRFLQHDLRSGTKPIEEIRKELREIYRAHDRDIIDATSAESRSLG